jgi:hypothetical protein
VRIISSPEGLRVSVLTEKFSQWKALLEAKDPKEIMNNRRLAQARQEINAEVEKQTHTPPKFSKDGKIAVLKIDSKAQVHPVIATRWVRAPVFCRLRLLKPCSKHKLGRTPQIEGTRDSDGCQLWIFTRESELFL